jgi:hypothetical protein
VRLRQDFESTLALWLATLEEPLVPAVGREREYVLRPPGDGGEGGRRLERTASDGAVTLELRDRNVGYAFVRRRRTTASLPG